MHLVSYLTTDKKAYVIENDIEKCSSTVTLRKIQQMLTFPVGDIDHFLQNVNEKDRIQWL